MTTYTDLSVYLPQGAIIVTQLNSEFRYILPRSKTLCFPFSMPATCQQVTIDIADTTPFQNIWIPGARSWASTQPGGRSMTSSPFQSQQSVNLPPNGIKWNFWLIDLQGSIVLDQTNINHWINSTDTYWMNVQNLQNRDSYFYCRFTYEGAGITIVE